MQQPIRVLQLFTIMNLGGAETNVMNYYRKLDASKIQFDFAVHRQEIGAYESEISILGGKIHRFIPLNPMKLKAYIKQIELFFDENNYDIIHGQCSELGYYFYKEAHKRKVPVIIAHGHNSNPKLDIKSPFRWFWKKRMMQYVNEYFTCGYEASIWLFGKKNANKAFTMTNAIDSSLFAFNVEKAAKMKLELQTQNAINIIHVGRFNEQKNHDFLIDIFNEVLKLEPNCKLFLVGDGELKSQIQNKVTKLEINDKVVFLGLRSNVNEILQAMDVFLFPSFFEGLPVSLVEAQASGTQCVISNGIPTEAILISDNVTVISLKESALSWAKKIVTLNIQSKKDVSQLIIDKGYDINKNVTILENKYIQLLSKHQ
ncbi:glycosyltransferase [Flavobacterium sp.]|uniref:glycosyltransferase n=1 Tax=Flavobacterium sp. TaxID=239 RepID=UPI003751B101